jgi:enoyl-CoA hydratase
VSEQVLFECEGAVARLTFNRPDARNAMTWAMYESLEARCAEIEADADIRLLILRGAGGQAFVAGTDITQFSAFREPADPLGYEERIDRIVGTLERLPCPTIAVLEGYCVGGGAALALACDFRIGTPALQFGIPIARTLGNTLSMANFSRLVDMLGPARTKEVVMLARLLNGEEALGVGLLTELVDAAALDATVDAMVERLLAMAPLTLKAAKESVRRVQLARRPEPERARDLILSCYLSEDFRSAVQAFTERRKPVWRGR